MKIEIAAMSGSGKPSSQFVDHGYGLPFPGKKEWGSPEADNHVPLQMPLHGGNSIAKHTERHIFISEL